MKHKISERTVILLLVLTVAVSILLIVTIDAKCSKTASCNEEVNALVIPAEKPIIFDEVIQINETVCQSVAEWEPDERDVAFIAKTLYGEARGVSSDMEKAAVAWCILNRVDTTGYACGHSVEYVVTFPNQFQGYSEYNPITDELRAVAVDVLIRHHRENQGDNNVGRVLPKEYIYFIGDGERNYFTTEFLGKDYWDWSLENPYED